MSACLLSSATEKGFWNPSFHEESSASPPPPRQGSSTRRHFSRREPQRGTNVQVVPLAFLMPTWDPFSPMRLLGFGDVVLPSLLLSPALAMSSWLKRWLLSLRGDGFR